MDKLIIKMKKIIIVFALFFTSLLVHSQNLLTRTQPLYNEISLGASIGSVLFWGDGSDNVILPFGKYFDKKERELSWDFFYETRLRPWVGVQTMFLKGNANGVREFWNNGMPANFRFESTFFQFSMQTNAYPLQITKKYRYSRIKPYVNFGLGVTAFKAAKYHLHTGELLNYYGYDNATLKKGNHIADFVIPFGFGADIDFDHNWALRVQNSFVYVTSDKFDGHIGRGTDINDIYTYTTIGIKYTFGKRQKMDAPLYDLRLVEIETTNVPPMIQTKKEPIEVIVKTEILIKTDSSQEPEIKVNTQPIEKDGIIIKPEVTVKTENFEKPVKEKEINEQKTEPEIKLRASDEVRIIPIELPEPDKTRELKSNVEFRIQVFASSRSTRTTQSIANLLNIHEYPITREVHDGLYKFTVGNYKKYEDAKVVKDKLKATRVPEAFIVFYVNGKRVSDIEEIYK